MIPATLTATQARRLLFHLLENVERSNHHYTVTKDGVPVAKVIGVEEWEGLMATLQTLAAPRHQRQLDQRLAYKGKFLTHEAVFGRRLPSRHRS